MAIFQLNGVDIKCPSSFDWSMYAVNSPDAGRDQNGLMYIEKITEKRTIGLSWLAITPSEAYTILSSFRERDYFTVTYSDPALCASENETVTKTFYLGDVSTAIHTWTAFKKIYANLAFNIIER